MAELVDARDSKSRGATHEGSIPSFGTISMKLFFDILIVILLVVSALPAGFLLYNLFNSTTNWEKKHKSISWVIIIILLLGFFTVLYGSFIEPYIVYVREEKIDLERIKKPIKIALIADFQVGPYKQEKFIERIGNIIIEQKPDLVFVAGDHINNSANLDGDLQYLSGFSKLASKMDVYAVAGNHEYGVSGNLSIYSSQYQLSNLSEPTQVAMEDMGIKYLNNKLIELQVNGENFYLFGGDSYWAQKLNLFELNKRKKDIPTIVMVHNPVAIRDIAGFGVDLVLSGHTHGGQIRLPFIGALKKVDKMLPRSWHKGWINYQKTPLFITSGVGETGVRARLYNRPEIVILTVY